MKRTSKILTAALILALMLGALAVLSSADTAETSAPELTQPVSSPALGYANVVFGDQLSLVFAVNANGYTIEGVVAYSSETDAEDKYSYILTETQDGIYQTKGIAAKDIAKTAYYSVIYKDGETVKYSAKQPYSVDAYLTAREALGEEYSSAPQMDLYEKIRAYGTAADAVLNPKTEK